MLRGMRSKQEGRMGNPAKGPVRYKVAEAARLTGVSASTLRLWELQGLIEPERTEGGQRTYSKAHLDQLKRIRWQRAEQGLNPAAIKAGLDSDTPATAGRQNADRIGKRARTSRQAQDKTLATVAGEAGIAVSALSTFERTGQGLSVRALHDLAAALGTSVSALSGTAGEAARHLVRSGEWQSWPQTMPGVTVQLLAEGRNQMDCHRFVLAPGASSEGAYRHEGEEFIHVLKGQLELTLAGEDHYCLSAGDSLYFKSSIHHAWKNIDDGETVLIWINTPPTF
jgi:DNA-binding transcriptional MerR regulator/quercetin dioxygenase-like cupin family protein